MPKVPFFLHIIHKASPVPLSGIYSKSGISFCRIRHVVIVVIASALQSSSHTWHTCTHSTGTTHLAQ
jgi:hypothetical protein